MTFQLRFMEKVIKIALLFFLMLSLGSCREKSQVSQRERFVSDNKAVDFSRWQGWHVSNRDNSYYIVQKREDDERLIHLIFWKEKSLHDGIVIKFSDPERSYSTLGDLPDNQIWMKLYAKYIDYHDFYDLVQLVYAYNIDNISYYEEEVKFVIDKDTITFSVIP